MYTVEEQKEHRKQWVAALRSGNYTQTRGVLRNAQGFCCLGVACDISGLGEWEAREDVINSYINHFDTLPRVVSDWLGISSSGHGINGNESFSLTILNDVSLYTFDQIADLIESEPTWSYNPGF